MANTIELTEKEEMVLRKICDSSLFNSDRVDLTKSIEDQNWEDRCSYYSFAETKPYGCGLSHQATRAVFGSLKKKGLIDIWNEEGDFSYPEVTWLTIGRKEFGNIQKTVLAK